MLPCMSGCVISATSSAHNQHYRSQLPNCHQFLFSEPSDVDKTVALRTQLLTMQIDRVYCTDEEALLPPEGRPIEEAICQKLNSNQVFLPLKRLPCLSTFDEAWNTPSSTSLPPFSFEENFLNRELRSLESHLGPDNYTLLDYMNYGEGPNVPEKDELGHDLSLNSRAGL